jgi:hypothetical protein
MSFAKNALKWGLMLGALVLCSGCTTTFDSAKTAKIHTVRLSGFENQVIHARTRFLKNELETNPDNGKLFASMMIEQNLQLGSDLKTAVITELQKDGYEVAGNDSAADATLDVTIGGVPPSISPAYEASSGNFEPEFSALVTLKDTTAGHTLFHIFYLYRDSFISPIDGSVLFRPDPKYGFQSANALFDHPGQAVEGFRAGISIIAQSIGTALKQP